MEALKKSDRVFVAGHRGLVGSAVIRRLHEAGYSTIVRTRSELDLERQTVVEAFLADERPDGIVVAAALVGGIEANRSRPAEFIARNISIQQNLIWGAHHANVPRLLFLASSCMYPRETLQPIPESALLSGPLEPTNAPYAVAKIAGVTLCDALRHQFGRQYFSVVPPNVYGPGDNFDPQGSHVLAAMVRRFEEALPNTPVVCWGSGRPRREFLFVDDLADACVYLLEREHGSQMINVGTGKAVSIAELASMVQLACGHKGKVSWDTTKPDGFPEKTMDVSSISRLGWQAQTSLEDGIRKTVAWFRSSLAEG